VLILPAAPGGEQLDALLVRTLPVLDVSTASFYTSNLAFAFRVALAKLEPLLHVRDLR